MEPNQNNQNIESVSNNDVVFRDKPKRNKGVIAGIVCLALLAIGGIGFGIWAMMDGNQQKNNLNEQIAELKKQNDELSGKSGETNEDEDAIIDVDGDSDVNTADYIYVGEWGIKIKKTKELKDISYRISSWDNDQYAGTSVCVSGAIVGHDNQIPSFLVPEGMVCLSKNSKTATDGGNTPYQLYVPVDEYYVDGPQALMGDGTDSDWEVESVKAIRKMLEDDSNRSPF